MLSALKAFDCPPQLPGASPLAHAAVLLVARTLLVSFGLPCPSVLGDSQCNGGQQKRAYELSATLTALLPTLIQPRGRPSVQATASVRENDDDALTREVLRFVMRQARAGRARLLTPTAAARTTKALRARNVDCSIGGTQYTRRQATCRVVPTRFHPQRPRHRPPNGPAAGAATPLA
jgi:hypothetical protein